MTLTTLGDRAQQFLTMRQNTRIRDALTTRATELSTGRVADVTAHLNGDTTALRDLDRRIALLVPQRAGAEATGRTLEAMQAHLGRVADEVSALGTTLVQGVPSANPAALAGAGAAGRDTFNAIVGTLGGGVAGQALFSGSAVDRSPLAPAADMRADIRLAVAGSTDAAGIAAAVANWFDAPGGGFETVAYLGETGTTTTRRIGAGIDIDIAVRADDPALRAALRGAAMASLADDPTLALSDDERARLVTLARDATLGAQAPLVDLRARIGKSEERVERGVATMAAQAAALAIARNGMDAADPFETAAALQEMQTRLETHYAVTARLSGLNLASYLR